MSSDDNSPTLATSNRERLLLVAGFAAAMLAGAALRLLGLGRQLIAGDEVHAMNAALAGSLGEILTTYRPTDGSIPLTAWLRLLLDSGVAPTETLMRAPVVAAGLVLPAVLGWIAFRLMGPRAAVAAAWLAALSPMWVYYGRVARPYGPSVLLAALSLGGLIFWWQRPARWKAALTAVAGALAIWWHPVSAPAVLAPIGWAAVRAIRQDRSRLPRVLLLAAATLAALALTVGPALGSLLSVAAGKGGDADFTGPSIAAATALVAGSDVSGVVFLFWTGVALGLWLARREDWVGFGAAAMIAQAIALMAFAPSKAGLAPVLARYLIWLLPVALLALARLFTLDAGASGSAAGDDPAPGWKRGAAALLSWPGRWLAVAVVLAAFFLAGPLADSRFRESPFAHQRSYLGYYAPAEPPEPLLEGVYEALAEVPGDEPVLELPWHPKWRYMRLLDAYQEIHGRTVIGVTGEPALIHRSTSFEHVLRPSPAGYVDSEARWLVLHYDWAREDGRVPLKTRVPRAAERPEARRVWRQLRRQAAAYGRQIERVLGPPVLKDPHRALWDLEAIRGSAVDVTEGPQPVDLGG